MAAVAALSVAGSSWAQSVKPSPAAAPATATGSQDKTCPALLQRTALRLQDEAPQPLCQYSGKVLLVVNTASFCGFTKQYQGLEALYAKYRDRGLVVLGFPSNDFGAQEPGDNKAIAEFCENTFNVKFPMFAKSVVKPGQADTNPLFADLARLSDSAPKWNFHKYLVSRDGSKVEAFGSTTAPDAGSLVSAVEKALAAK